jgi:hypothetical protein
MRTLFIALAICLGTQLSAAEPNTLTDEEKKDGWKLLFDGKTLNGWNFWKTKKQLEDGQGWKVVDGTLSRVAKGGDIYSAEAYENYEFKIDWKTQGNSGIMIRVDPSQGGPIYKVAPEMQVDKNGGTKSTSPGGLYAIIDVGEVTFNKGGWNSVKIRMKDGVGTHWFNGKEVYTYTIGSDDWKERIAKSKWKKTKGYAETAKGHFGLQEHGANVSFRNIKIKVLK